MPNPVEIAAVSSPGAIVYCHVDCPVNMLWHLRRTKRVWAYPLESGIGSDETIEGILCGEKSEELQFRAEWDELVVTHDLQPGEFRSTELSGWRPAFKEFALRVMRRIPVLAPPSPEGYQYPITFEVDLDAPLCVRQREEASQPQPALH